MFFFDNRRYPVDLTTSKKIDSRLSLSNTHKERSRKLTDKYNNSRLLLSPINEERSRMVTDEYNNAPLSLSTINKERSRIATDEHKDSPLSSSAIYKERAKLLTDQCTDSRLSSPKYRNDTSFNSIRQLGGFGTLTLLLRSQSLMYCAVPKVATKTLLTILVYVHLLEISKYLQNDSTVIGFDHGISKSKLVKMSALIWAYQKNVRSNSINIPRLSKAEQIQKKTKPTQRSQLSRSLPSLIQMYLDLLRTNGINSTSSSTFNLWRIDLPHALPYIRFESLSNLSAVLSSHFTRVLFVRHPFDRLASAYTERIALLENQRVEPEPFYDKIRRLICKLYSSFSTVRRAPGFGDPCLKVIPPFEHFIKYVLYDAQKMSAMDLHWKPYSILCKACTLKYNFIGRYETINEDLTYLLKRLNLSEWDPQKRRGSTNRSTQTYKEMYLNISDELICQLNDLYLDDFRLFNYRPEDYVDRPSLLCQHNTKPKIVSKSRTRHTVIRENASLNTLFKNISLET